MKITFFSDTHTKHDNLKFPEADVLVCTGDFTNKGSLADVEDFCSFMLKQPHKHIIVIAGNHDFCFENKFKSDAEHLLKVAGITYLNDSGCIIDGVKFWGSPVQPWFYDWAFNRQRGDDIKKHWNLIPDDIDVLLTHGPPYNILDKCKDGSVVGCQDLMNRIHDVKPKIHAFGHIHESYGIFVDNHTTYINSSILDHRYKFRNEPITIEIL